MDIELEDVIQAAGRMITGRILALLQTDPHAWSTRPCDTCRTVTSLAGEPFGCVKYAKDKAARARRKATEDSDA